MAETRVTRTVVKACALTGIASALAFPAAAGGHHDDCRWGAHAAVDPTRPEPVRYRVGAPTWGCPGPVAQATVGAGGYGVTVQATGAGVDWWTTEPSRVGPESSSPSPSVSEETAGETLRLIVSPRSVVAGRRVVFRARVIRRDASGELPAGNYAIRLAGRTARTGAGGRARLAVRPRRPGRMRVVALDGRRRVATALVRVHARR